MDVLDCIPKSRRIFNSVGTFDFAALAEIARKTAQDIDIYGSECLFAIAFTMAEQARTKEAWALFNEANEIGPWDSAPLSPPNHEKPDPLKGTRESRTIKDLQSIGWDETRAVAATALPDLWKKPQALSPKKSSHRVSAMMPWAACRLTFSSLTCSFSATNSWKLAW